MPKLSLYDRAYRAAGDQLESLPKDLTLPLDCLRSLLALTWLRGHSAGLDVVADVTRKEDGETNEG